MAIVLNEEIAKSSPCVCYNYDGNEICWTAGCVGILTDEQEKKYCKEKISKGEISPKLKQSMNRFAHAVEICKDDYKKMGYDNYWQCLSEHLKAK